MKVICAQCHSPLEWPDAKPELLEKSTISVVVIHHNLVGYCKTCKTKVALSVRDIRLMLVALPLREEEKSLIVIAPASALPPAR